MTSPNEALMDAYGTRELFEEKLAEMSPWVPRVIGGLGALALLAGMQHNRKESVQQQQDVSELGRQLELAKMQRANEGLRHTTPAFIIPPGYDVPVGLDQGMVRMASALGADLAKEAGIGGMLSGLTKNLQGASQAVKGWVGGLKMPATPNPVSAAQTGSKMMGGLGLGMKGNLALGGLAVAGLYGGSKAINAGANYLQKEPSGPATYGAGRFGAQLPYGVNQYGQPQVGTPLM